MGQFSDIAWTHATFNPWEGCEKVSPGCAHCYAEARNQRFHGGEHWGRGAARLRRSESYWREPLKWNAAAERAGERHRVFCASLADVFENRADLSAERARLFQLIEQCTALDWLLLTKRPQHMRAMLPSAWLASPLEHIWLGTTCEDQKRLEERLPELVATPAAVRFLSLEPLLEDLNLQFAIRDPHPIATPHDMIPAVLGVDWVIVGGESEERTGPRARPFDPDWARHIMDDCRMAGIPVFVKQMGSSPVGLVQLRQKKGTDMTEWPEDLRVRELPYGRA